MNFKINLNDKIKFGVMGGVLLSLIPHQVYADLNNEAIVSFAEAELEEVKTVLVANLASSGHI